MTNSNSILPGDLLSSFLVLVIAGLLFMLFHFSNLAPALSGQTLDFLFLQRGPVIPRSEIVIIGIDEDSLKQLGSWPFPRKLHASLLSHLKKARAIGFDILFSEPSPQDKILSQAFVDAPPVILGVAHNYRGRILEPARTLQNYTAKGLIETILDKQAIVRRIDTSYLKESAAPALLARVMADFATPPRTTFPDKHSLINFYGPEGTFLSLSYADVLAGIYPDDFFTNRFILIGVAALGLGDSHVTPFSLAYPMPGVEIQATLLSNILENNLIAESAWFPWAGLAVVVLLSTFVWPRVTEQWNICINVLFVLLVSGASFLFFHRSLYLDPSGPVVFLLIVYLVHLLYERIRTANEIISEISRVDKQIQIQLQSIYTHVPAHFIQDSSPPTKSKFRLNLKHLQAGIKTLSLQHHFIEKLLREDLPPLILWESESGRVILANRMFKKLWQSISHEPTQLPALHRFQELLPGDPAQINLLPATCKPDVQLPGTQQTVADICLEIAGRKNFFHVQMHQVSANDAGFKGILSILTDITEIKKLEILKDEIMSIVSHELKLPLTVMLGYGELLSDSLSGRDKQQIDKILTQTIRMKKLIEHFLDIARLEHGRQDIQRLPFNPLHLIDEAIQAISAVENKKNISIVKDVPFKATVLVGDFSLLNQALINLLDNAVKFSPEKTTITLRLTEEENQLVFCVIDQGPGIPADVHQNIFNKFNRGNNEPSQEGFGLGLAFVREVIQQNGGSLYLEPQTDQGASFCFSIPKYDTSCDHP